MNRRNFIEKSAILGTTALLPFSSCSAEQKAKFKMGYQLYSIRDEMAKDTVATLKALKKMGYEDFETYGYNSEEDTFYGYKSKEFKIILDDLQLTTSSGHFGFSPFLHQSDDDLIRFVDQAIIGAKALNMKYITWPWIAPELRTLDNFKLMAGKLNGIGEQISAAGLGFAYHNHGFEFIDHDGENAFDIILKETDPALVKLEIDMYWVMHSSNFTPKELVKKQPGRYVMWHIKDMDKVSRDYTELGNGSIDYVEMLPDPIESGLEFYFIEQGGNYAHNSTRSASDSADYFKKNLQKFL
ncbi:MAG: sugar phosphate isomerase/epimerase family protein [Saprospiraceae bacterium]